LTTRSPDAGSESEAATFFGVAPATVTFSPSVTASLIFKPRDRRREPGFNLDYITIIACDCDRTAVYDVVTVEDRDLWSFGAEYQRRGRRLDQAPRFEIKSDLNIKAGHMGVV